MTSPTRDLKKRTRSAAYLGQLVRYATAAALLYGCGPEFDSRMTLDGYRVIGVEASPPEVKPNEALRLTAREYYDGSSALLHEWSLCLHSAGASAEYECSQTPIQLGNGASLNVDLGPDGLDLSTLLEEEPMRLGPDGASRHVDQGVELWVRLVSGPDCQNCERVTTVKRLTVRNDPASTPNANPIIEELSVVGSKQADGTVTLRVRTDEPERFLNPMLGTTEQEDYLYTWFTSQGLASPARTTGTVQETELDLPHTPGSLEVIVAVRDGRGGLAVERIEFEID